MRKVVHRIGEIFPLAPVTHMSGIRVFCHVLALIVANTVTTSLAAEPTMDDALAFLRVNLIAGTQEYDPKVKDLSWKGNVVTLTLRIDDDRHTHTFRLSDLSTEVRMSENGYVTIVCAATKCIGGQTTLRFWIESALADPKRIANAFSHAIKLGGGKSPAF